MSNVARKTNLDLKSTGACSIGAVVNQTKKENIMSIKVFEQVEKREHEQVVFLNFPKVGLKAIIAVHNTILGPALGGCRMRNYTCEDEAIDDVLRLSEGMTYKNSLANLDLGGGKMVLFADPSMQEGRKELFTKVGECVESLSGKYITAEDMGTTVNDIMVMREVTHYAAGFSKELGGGGDPSPWTALGVFRGTLAASERRYNSKDLSGKKIAIQGVGHVGIYLIEYLTKAGATCIVCDTNEKTLNNVKSKFNVEVVDIDKIYDVDCDIFAPCAVGQTVNKDTIKRLKCDIIAGSANNILSDSSMHLALNERKIIYCPDFAINAGGVISVGGEYRDGGWDEAWVTEKVDAIYDTIHAVLKKADETGRNPEVIAVELAKDRINKAQQK